MTLAFDGGTSLVERESHFSVPRSLVEMPSHSLLTRHFVEMPSHSLPLAHSVSDCSSSSKSVSPFQLKGATIVRSSKSPTVDRASSTVSE